MRTVNIKSLFLTLLVAVLLLPTLCTAAVMNDYCIVPPFIQEIAKPNLLMILDNSASMFDLAYDDRGYSCSVTRSISCVANSDCPSGETCSQLRNPTYCYDQSFSSDNSYVGYFDPEKKYHYNFTSGRFEVMADADPIPSSCAMAAVANQVYCKIISDTLHVNIDKTDATRTKYFYATGKYLNWLTASKFDVEKQVLTGGKYVTKQCYNTAASKLTDKACLTDTECGSGHTCNAVSAFLQPESRGCVGMGYVKNALTANFTNYPTGTTDPNTNLGLTFLVKGPANPFNPVSPSTGGQTYLEIYSKTGVPYDNEACEKAIVSIATGTNADIKKDVDSCLASSGAATGLCSQNSSLECMSSYGPVTPNCDKPVVSPNPHCSTAPSKSCTVANQATDCQITGASKCTTGKVGDICTGNAQCDVKTCSTNAARSCSVNTDCVKATETMGTCNKKQQTACRTNADCISGGGKIDNGPCDGYVAAYNDGSCVVSTTGTCTVTPDFYAGPCVTEPSGYLGPCVFSSNEVEVRTKVSFSQSMQACWSLRKGTAIGNDEVNTVKNQCSDIYGGYKTCLNSPFQLCTVNADCSSGTCLDGPAAIQPGNPALMCSLNYEGQLFEKIGTSWVFRSTLPAATPGACLATDSVTDCAKKIHEQFCNAMETPVVTDPTNPPGPSTTTENLPAILTGIGVEAQLGAPIARLPVRVETAAVPTNLVQEYANKIRIGLMSFNTYGSSSETSTTAPLPAGKLRPTKVCSNDPTMVCLQAIDCGPGNSCDTAEDRDAAKVLSLVGHGHCSTTIGTECSKKAHCPTGEVCLTSYCSVTKTRACTLDANCPSGETCVNYAGTHTTPEGLVYKIDSLRAATWTPFAEAFYNAIGYFAVDPGDTTGKSSRTDLRINSSLLVPANNDFPTAMNPSEYVCQANNILLVTDGSSTADQNSDKTAVVNVYKSESGNVTGNCTKYAGSQDLDDLAWIARHRNINEFSTSALSPELPQKKNQMISSYVVFNGSDNGESDDCNNTTLLTKAAVNGGSTLYRTDIPSEYERNLRKAFEAVAGGTASGTAASILSNSEGSGANILQAVFYPTRDFEKLPGETLPTSASWIGEMQNLWYYVDPFIGNSSVRENTNTTTPADLDIINDFVVEFQFKGGETMAVMKKDTDGNGSGDLIVTNAMDARVKSQGYCTNASVPTSSSFAKCETTAACKTGETCVTQGIVDADDVKSLWRAGKKLWERNITAGNEPRNIYTYLYNTSVTGCTDPFSVNELVNLVGLKKLDGTALSANDKCVIYKLLQATNETEALEILKFTHGFDPTGTIDGVTPRKRSVAIARRKADGTKLLDASDRPVTDTHVWKLGDIIASTPRIQSFNRLNNYQLEPPAGYADMTYANDSNEAGFANSTAYKDREMAYAGANDGMLHAFHLGKLEVTTTGDVKAKLNDPSSNMGKEAWAFVPKHVLPYLKYLADPEYSHLYLVDGPTKLVDASIGYNDNSYIPAGEISVYSGAGCDATGTGSHTKYWACKRDPATNNNKSWRSILIGSMGIGGASAAPATACSESVPCVPLPLDGIGYSSYFALDITDPNNPVYLWEFKDADMGAATTGVGVVRIGYKFTDGSGTYGREGSNPTNGRWFAVIGNGPTGPIDTTYHQFKGKSNKPLQLFVLDLKTGALLRKMQPSPAISTAFAGSLSSAPIDTDRTRRYDDGFYADDALYFGYSNCQSDCTTSTPVWNGGIMRLMTDEQFNGPEDGDPNNDVNAWSLTTLVNNIGPVTTAVNKLQDRKNANLWLYTGTGRYFFKGDDSDVPGKIIGIKEPCYDKVNNDIYKKSVIDTQSPKCSEPIVFASGDFADQTSSIDAVDDKKGWFITMLDKDTTDNYGAERVITEPAVMPNGAVFFTSFMPSTDICNYGGKSFMWGMRYDTGGAALASQLQGKALVQVSTGSFEEVNLATALTANLNRKMAAPMTGKPPTDPPPIVSGAGNKPLKRIMHIREK